MLLTIVAFFAILSILVFAHELGHFWTARKFGAKTEEFGFGFPPRIGGWKLVNGKRKFFWGNKDVESDDTIYSLNWIPIGGFVKIKGEDGEGNTDSESFASKKPWQRGIILSAGVIMNVFLTTFCLILVFMIGAPQIVDIDEAGTVKDHKVQIMSVVDDSPAKTVGLQLGDVVKSINDQTFNNVEEMGAYIATQADQEMTVIIARFGDESEYKVTPVGEEKAVIGVGLVDTGIVSYPWYKAIWLGIKGTWTMFTQIIVGLSSIITNAVVGEEIGADIAGPIGIAVITGKVARMGFSYILQFTALLSMNLAIINFLPLPALDGGRILFLIIEKIRGKPVNQKVEGVIHTIGFFLLIALMLLVTGRDLFNIKDIL